jgi:hypothetical protein
MLTAWVLSVAAAAAMPSDPVCGLSALPGLSRQFASVIRAENGPAAAGTAEEFARVAAGVLGEEAGAGVDWATRTDLPCGEAVRRRDHLASQMAMVGHSPKEMADVLKGHLTIADLNQARARLMAGQPRVRVAEFIEARWHTPSMVPVVFPASPGRAASRADTPWLEVDLEQEIETLEREHAVPADLVRAMVNAESGGNPRAVSPAGAIGLMQLMPATAAALGIDPWQPRENLRGGVAYIADLMRAYDGDIRLALIAYNAGPQHANRVRAGSTVAYKETRRYLDAIALHYPLP